MSVVSINRRLDRIAGGGGLDIAAILDTGHQRARAWRDAGNTGPVPRAPLAPPPKIGTRIDHKMWRTLAEAHARVAFLTTGEVDDLLAAYAMNDADLWHTVFQRGQAA